MLNLIVSILYPIIVLGLSIFIIYRLKIGYVKESGSGGFVYAGLSLIFVFSLINLLQQHPDYPEWFLAQVYAWFTLGSFVVLSAGLILFVIGLVLHFNFWGERDIEVSNHLEKLKLLDNIQQESRYPFPMPELLDRVLKSLLGGLGEEAGAVFLLNRSQRKFLLVTGAGLSKEETSLLEYYPYGRNLVTQAIEDETTMISSDFRSLGGKAQLAASRFHSIIVVPLISGRSKLGALLFFAREENRYSREFISLITPIAEWLSEKMEVNMTGRDLRKSREALELKDRQLSGFIKKLEKVFKSDEEISSPADFAERCVGLIGADEVWLVGLADGRLVFHGGTGSRADFSDNFRAAMISALAQNKAVILNQEGTDEDGNTYIARSSLMLPADSRHNALLLRNNGGKISVGSEDFRALEIIASVGGMVVARALAGAVGASRSKGLKLIADILQLKIDRSDPGRAVMSFMPHLARGLSEDSILMLYHRDDGKYKAVYCSSDDDIIRDISIDSGEGSVGRAAALKTESVHFDTAGVADMLANYHEENRELLYRIFGERKIPSFSGSYPVVTGENIDYVIDFYGFGERSLTAKEEHRLMSLLTGLLNLRINILQSSRPRADVGKIADTPIFTAEQLNEINNDLLAISGYCQLASQDPNLTGTVESSFKSIMELTEKMAAGFKSLASIPELQDKFGPDRVNLRDIIRDVFKRNAISGNLHMIEGRAFSVNLNLQNIPDLDLRVKDAVAIIEGMSKSFVKSVGDDEIITISTYANDKYVYIDISRHREKFPPVEPVIGFGIYAPAQNYESRFAETGFLRLLSELAGEFAYDRYSKNASYYSLRLPIKATSGIAAKPSGKTLSILAIDDQAVILDLLAAMCQSLGYTIYTAREGEDGIRIFQTKKPDLVISDLAMPNLSGWDVASRIKAISPGTPVIIITGWGVTVDEGKMKQAGADFLLHKPFRLEQLSEIITKAGFSRINS